MDGWMGTRREENGFRVRSEGMDVCAYVYSVSELSSHGEASGEVGAERKIGAGKRKRGRGLGGYQPRSRDEVLP